MAGVMNSYDVFFYYDLLIFMRIFFIICIVSMLFLFIYLFFLTNSLFNFKFNNITLNNFKGFVMFIVFSITVYTYFMFIYIYISWFNKFIVLNNTLISNNITIFFKDIKLSLINFNLYYFNLFSITLSKFNISFLLLFCTLYPIIFLLMSYDYNFTNYRFYLYMLLIFILSFFLLLTDNIVLFYFIYELILILVFGSMYISSNSRGGIEATLFFAGWAVLGSILVSLGFIIIIVTSNTYQFSDIQFSKFTSSESYYIYLLFFFGFGTKLSTWPFWYWLPRAHVEVSTSMSIFLSCILIKLSFFCLLKIKFIFLSEISFNLCILVTLLCVFDITFRLINLKDLKAIIAYSSVLHTNLLLTLIHFDTFHIMNNSTLYIWGHSLSTAAMFLIVNLIESKYGSRNILQISGLWYSSPFLSILTFWSLISFLDLPITMFFWGELWLWVIVVNKVIISGIQIMFLSLVLFSSIFFKIWWNLLFGTPTHLKKINDSDFFSIELLILWLLILQFLVGILPSILTSSVGYINY